MKKKPKAIVAGMAANVVIAGAKFVAAFFSDSSAMNRSARGAWSD